MSREPVQSVAVSPGQWPLDAPSSDYMSAMQKEYSREARCAERDALLRAADGTVHRLQEFEATPDPSDRASLEEDHSLELWVRDRGRKHLHRIDAVLMHIRDGSYGWCEESGEAIGLERWIARPTATLSFDAQLRREQRRRMLGR